MNNIMADIIDIRNKIHKLCDTIEKIGNEEKLESWLNLSKKWKNESDDYIKQVMIYKEKLLEMHKKANMLF